GNRQQVTTDGAATGYTTNNINQYSQSSNAAFDYDADGNLTAKTVGVDIWNYTYNSDNRLVSVDGPEGLIEYQYDGLGNLTAVIKNGITTHYLIDPSGYGNTVGEYDDTGILITRYNHGMGLISKDDYYFTFDGSGNTSGLTDGTGALANSYVYEPFGEVMHSTETVGNEFQFVGQFGIRQAGDLYFMRNRFYMPSTGRFINEDPIGLAGGINMYAYVINDPVNFVDPLGLETLRPGGAKYYFGRPNTFIPPGSPRGRYLENKVSHMHQTAKFHDPTVDYLKKNGVPDWLANYPTMLPSFIAAVVYDNLTDYNQPTNNDFIIIQINFDFCKK
ncbi:MAG: RHS repeat-associated core domain-containing protein, partial [Bacteroidota bacterium]